MFNIAARAWEPLSLGARTLFATARQTVPRFAARIPRTPARTFASRSYQAPTWQKYASAGAFCAAVGVSSYYAHNAEAAAAVIEVKSADASITVTVEGAPEKPQESKPEPSLENIELIVCDMAGTTVMEGGVVYATLRGAMNADGLNVSEEEMHAWHGAKKEAVIEHFAKEHGKTPEGELQARVKRVSKLFEDMIHDAYFGENSPVDVIAEDLKSWILLLQARGTQVGLDTGYPPQLQMDLMKKLGLDTVVNGHVSSYEVREGRPAPYMIFKLMSDLGVMDVQRVAKVGDTVRDIQEGKNAGCGLVVGVLSGADSREKLLAAGADIVVDVITDLKVPANAVGN